MNLNQVTIPVLNVDKSIEFYKLLGLKLIVHTHERYARFECGPGGSTFSLHKVEKIGNGEKAVVYFETENVDEVVSQLLEKGVQIDLLPTDQPWLWRESRLCDPDQNPIIIYSAGENRLNPPWRIK